MLIVNHYFIAKLKNDENVGANALITYQFVKGCYSTMYKRAAQGWLKHLDFILFDELCLQIAFGLAYIIRHGIDFPYMSDLYRAIAILMIVFDLLIAVMMDSMHNVLKRGYYKEFAQTVKHCLMVFLLTVLWMFTLKNSDSYSRIIVFLTFVFHVVIGYGIRLLWKAHLRKRGTLESGKKSMLAVLDLANADRIIERLTSNALDMFHLSGVVIADEATNHEYKSFVNRLPLNDNNQMTIRGIPIVCSFEEAPHFICREWIDSVYISCQGDRSEIREFMSKCGEMAVTIHYHVPSLGQDGNKQFVEKVGSSTVVTNSVNYATPTQLITKRIIDILGGIIGSFFALLTMVILGPMIKKESPGPILYKSERIGQNGKRFWMLKIRSMYLNADANKALLMAQNRIKDGMMFKLDFDPRIIGNEELSDGTHKTGIGEFIRKTSLDEFPQFFNVLKGDMSLVGTRPPTPDEWEKYEFHHRARLATKPGITGMWQVSGRSEITDFEEVVKLDTQYIQNWNLGLDIKILLKTVINVLTRKGAM